MNWWHKTTTSHRAQMHNSKFSSALASTNENWENDLLWLSEAMGFNILDITWVYVDLCISIYRSEWPLSVSFVYKSAQRQCGLFFGKPLWFDTSFHPLATGPEPPTDYSLENPSDLTQRLWISWCPVLGFWVTLQKFGVCDYECGCTSSKIDYIELEPCPEQVPALRRKHWSQPESKGAWVWAPNERYSKLYLKNPFPNIITLN